MKKKEMHSVSLKVHFSIERNEKFQKILPAPCKKNCNLDKDYLKGKQFLLKILEIVSRFTNFKVIGYIIATIILL